MPFALKCKLNDFLNKYDDETEIQANVVVSSTILFMRTD